MPKLSHVVHYRNDIGTIMDPNAKTISCCPVSNWHWDNNGSQCQNYLIFSIIELALVQNWVTMQELSLIIHYCTNIGKKWFTMQKLSFVIRAGHRYSKMYPVTRYMHEMYLNIDTWYFNWYLEKSNETKMITKKTTELLPFRCMRRNLKPYLVFNPYLYFPDTLPRTFKEKSATELMPISNNWI